MEKGDPEWIELPPVVPGLFCGEGGGRIETAD
jgi:hypothetical protein